MCGGGKYKIDLTNYDEFKKQVNGVDTGNIIFQARTQATKRDNFATYPYLQIAGGVKILSQAICDVLDGNVTSINKKVAVDNIFIRHYINI